MGLKSRRSVRICAPEGVVPAHTALTIRLALSLPGPAKAIDMGSPGDVVANLDPAERRGNTLVTRNSARPTGRAAC